MQANRRVKVVNTSKQELNGQTGTEVQYDPDKGRYTIQLDNGQRVALKPDNVEYLPKDESKGGGGGFGGFPGMGGMGGIPGLNPEVMMQAQQLMQQVVTTVQSMLPPGVSLQNFGYGALAVVGLLVYKIGMIKGLLFSSIFGGILFVAAPVYKQNGGGITGAKKAWQHIGSMVSDKIHSQIGKRFPTIVSHVLLVLTIVLAVCFCFSLFVFSPAYVSSSTAGAGGGGTLDEIYSAGYADGQKNAPYGTSKPASSSSSSSSPSSSMMGGLLSRFGIMEIMMLGFWGKTVYDLGSYGGSARWSPAAALQGLRGLPPYRLALLGFTIVRMLGIF